MDVIAVAGAAEIEELRSVLRSFLEDKAPVARTLELIESEPGHDEGVWRQMADQLALQGIAIPEQYGGQGFGLGELGVVLEELGRVVYSGPFLSTAVLAAQALLLSGDDDACAEHLPGIAAGELTATLASFEPDARWSLAPATEAVRDGGGWRLSGAKGWVLDGKSAELIIATARCEDGVGLFAIGHNAPGLRAEPVNVLDLTRPMATLRLDGVPADRIGAGDASVELLPALNARALAALACEQAGGTQACLEMTSEYVSERIQFGRPIGSYQAVRHRCADMFVAAECSRAAARNAMRALEDGDSDLVVAVGVAKSYCSDAFLRVAGDTIQLHGGIGFTWEHPAHLYFKRAKSSALIFGDPAEHRARIGPELLSPATPTEV